MEKILRVMIAILVVGLIGVPAVPYLRTQISAFLATPRTVRTPDPPKWNRENLVNTRWRYGLNGILFYAPGEFVIHGPTLADEDGIWSLKGNVLTLNAPNTFRKPIVGYISGEKIMDSEYKYEILMYVPANTPMLGNLREEFKGNWKLKGHNRMALT